LPMPSIGNDLIASKNLLQIATQCNKQGSRWRVLGIATVVYQICRHIAAKLNAFSQLVL